MKGDEERYHAYLVDRRQQIQVNPAPARAATKRWSIKNREHIREYNKKRWENGPGKESDRRYTMKIKAECLTAYGGPRCACCGETIVDFLCIDHVNGGGGQHARSIGGAGTNLYRWLKRSGYPSGFQVLCYNCNIGKARNGRCPHQTLV